MNEQLALAQLSQATPPNCNLIRHRLIGGRTGAAGIGHFLLLYSLREKWTSSQSFRNPVLLFDNRSLQI